MSKKLVHHLFGQHSLGPVQRSEVDMSPAQIFTYGGQHPPVSRILVLSLNAHSCLQQICKAYGQVPKRQTPSKRMETSKHPNFWTSSAISRHVHVAVKKRDTVAFALCSCRSLVKTSKQQVFVDTGGESNNMLNLGDIRRPTSKLRCAACGASTASTARCSEQIIKAVKSSDGEFRINERMIIPKNTQEKNFTHDTKVG